MNKDEIKKLTLENEHNLRNGLITKDQALQVLHSIESSFINLSIEDQLELLKWIEEEEPTNA